MLSGYSFHPRAWGALAAAASRSHDQRVAASAQRHRIPEFIVGRFAVDIRAPLYPGGAAPVIDTGLAGIDAIAVVTALILAATYRLGAREIRSAAEMAGSLASLRGDGFITIEDLKAAARTQSQPRLTSLAQKITPSLTP